MVLVWNAVSKRMTTVVDGLTQVGIALTDVFARGWHGLLLLAWIAEMCFPNLLLRFYGQYLIGLGAMSNRLELDGLIGLMYRFNPRW
jgi:hypothetical protein